LLGWKIDVKSEQRYANLENPAYRALMQIDGMDEALADRLFASGLTTVALLASTDVDRLMGLARIDQEKAERILQAAGTVAVTVVNGNEQGGHDPEATAPENQPTVQE
jgi:N utilization substance protein A